MRVTDFTVRTNVSSPFLTARVGNGSIRLLNLNLSDARVLRRGPGKVGTWVVRVQSTLTSQAAAALNAAFGSSLTGGIPIGRVDVQSLPARSSSTAAPPRSPSTPARRRRSPASA